MDAEELRMSYIAELRLSLQWPRDPMVNVWQTATLIAVAEAESGAVYDGPDAGTWIWSDLHLGHEPSVGAFGRPFADAAEADPAMLHAWTSQVGADETIICLGDLTVDGQGQASHQNSWRRAPGKKLVVVDNHDVDPINQRQPFDAERRTVALLAPGDPELLLTHVPLTEVPHSTVNVHGHLHEKASPAGNRHSVSVEELGYRPARLAETRRRARRLAEGRTVPGATTRARLDMVERVMP